MDNPSKKNFGTPLHYSLFFNIVATDYNLEFPEFSAELKEELEIIDPSG